jgi:KUP system potassium uptake protein
MTQAVHPKQTAVSTEVTERPATALACMAALGIVYGDLGTSPLYTYQAIVGAVGGQPSAAEAIGLLSLVVWALLITVSFKYCVFVMRADNHGEGGILALMSLVTDRIGPNGRGAGTLIICGLFGAALIYGDGVITPAISVLSALEGVNVVTPVFKPYVLPLALVVLVGLFAIQARGTESIGRVFGPVMMLWFLTIAVLGLSGLVHHPEVLRALDPTRALNFLVVHGWHSFVVLGGVFLAVTGGEALYADMGHFGRNPIRVSWYFVVLPALLLSYAGQTSLLIDNPAMTENPFFKLAPEWAVIPLVVLATLATIIASQAIITGAFSLTRQAMQLGWFPGMNIRQTSDLEYGQIYVGFVNWAMMIGTLTLTYSFGSSDRLAGAYGTAVSTTMLLTTALLYNAMRDIWGWSKPAALAVSSMFLVVDLGFFGANLLKIADGGWIPLAMGIALFLVMTTWHRGVDAIRGALIRREAREDEIIADLASGRVARVPGTAVFLSRSGKPIPWLMVRHIAQMKALQETAVSLSIHFEARPRVPMDERIKVKAVAEGIWHITLHFGFIEVPDVASTLALAHLHGCLLNLDDAVYFAARDALVPSTAQDALPAWRRILFTFMYRNAVRLSDRFSLPADKFVEIGRQAPI